MLVEHLRHEARGWTVPLTGDHLAAATAEGWIVIPDERTAVGISLTRPSRQNRTFTSTGADA